MTSGTTDGAAGVKGESEGNTGATYGVDGTTASGHSEAAGVRGRSAQPNQGVLGDVYDNEGNLNTLSSGESAGVFGRNDKTDGFGTVGWSNNHHGLLGRSDDSASAGVLANNSAGGTAMVSDGDTQINGNANVTGYADVQNTGFSASRSTNQSIPDGTDTTIAFDQTEADHFGGGFDTTNGVYTVQQDGDYHVDFKIEWADGFADGDRIEYYLYVNGGLANGFSAFTDIPGSMVPSRSFSKTIFGLSETDEIWVDVWQNSGGSKDVFGNADGETYLTAHKVG